MKNNRTVCSPKIPFLPTFYRNLKSNPYIIECRRELCLRKKTELPKNLAGRKGEKTLVTNSELHF